MKIILHKNFLKRYQKLQHGEQQKTDERILLFQQNSFHPLLDNHALHDPYRGCRSINITGDLRAIYKEIGADLIHFIELGTHHELYGS